jgi:hypothetical protein
MGEFAVRAIVSGVIVAIVAIIARRYPAMGALIASLPLISILAMIWLWRDTGNTELLAGHVQATFFFGHSQPPHVSHYPRHVASGDKFLGFSVCRHIGDDNPLSRDNSDCGSFRHQAMSTQ